MGPIEMSFGPLDYVEAFLQSAGCISADSQELTTRLAMEFLTGARQ